MRFSEWKATSRAASTHSALPVSMRTTARLAVTTASGSKVALRSRTLDPDGSTPGRGAAPGAPLLFGVGTVGAGLSMLHATTSVR